MKSNRYFVLLVALVHSSLGTKEGRNSIQEKLKAIGNDTEEWGALVSTLETDPMAYLPDERTQILNKLYQLFEEDQIAVNLVLKASKSLKYEKDLEPWTGFVNEFGFWDKKLMASNLAQRWQAYLRGISGRHYDEYKLRPYTRRYLAPDTVEITVVHTACANGYKPCLEDSLNFIERQLKNKSNLAPHSRLPYEVAVSFGGEEAWNLVKNLSLRSEGEALYNLTAALMATKDETRIEEILTEALNTTSPVNAYVSRLFSDGVCLFERSHVVEKLLRSHWDQLKSLFTGNQLAKISDCILVRVATEKDLEAYEEFLDKVDKVWKVGNLKDLERWAREGMEDWIRYRPEFEDFLLNYTE